MRFLPLFFTLGVKGMEGLGLEDVSRMGIINFHYLEEVFQRYGRIWLKRKIVKLVCFSRRFEIDKFESLRKDICRYVSCKV